jgi:hypothetical protein
MQKACTAKREKHSEPNVKGTEESPLRSFVCGSGLVRRNVSKAFRGLHFRLAVGSHIDKKLTCFVAVGCRGDQRGDPHAIRSTEAAHVPHAPGLRGCLVTGSGSGTEDRMRRVSVLMKPPHSIFRQGGPANWARRFCCTHLS